MLLFFIVLSEAVLFALTDALDIGAVHIDHHAGHKAGANGTHQHITGGIACREP